MGDTGRAGLGNKTQVSFTPSPLFNKHEPCTYQVPGILPGTVETVPIKMDDDPAITEAEVELENKQENKDTNKIISDHDKCQEDNRTGKWDKEVRVEDGSYF